MYFLEYSEILFLFISVGGMSTVAVRSINVKRRLILYKKKTISYFSMITKLANILDVSTILSYICVLFFYYFYFRGGLPASSAEFHGETLPGV